MGAYAVASRGCKCSFFGSATWPGDYVEARKGAGRSGRLPIIEDAETGTHAWGRTIALADAHKLTVYNATYLELAVRLSLPLATLDEDLRGAAAHEGIPLLGK